MLSDGFPKNIEYNNYSILSHNKKVRKIKNTWVDEMCSSGG